MPAINVNLGKPKVVPVALILIPQLHWITFLRVIFIIKALGNGWVEEYLKWYVQNPAFAHEVFAGSEFCWFLVSVGKTIFVLRQTIRALEYPGITGQIHLSHVQDTSWFEVLH
jgi:hypothetical protein